MKMNDPRPKEQIEEEYSKYRRFKKVVLESTTHATKTRGVGTASLAPYSGEWTSLQVSHLLKRATFGVRPHDIDQFTSLGLEEAVNTLIKTPELDPPVNNYFFYKEDPHALPGETWIDAPQDVTLEFPRLFSLKYWLMKQALEGEPSLHPKMSLFWHNLIPTQFFDLALAKASYQYYKIFLDHAFGNFKEIILKVTLDPAMLFYLNGYANVKEAPDENYARELQELFTLGKGPDSNYTESDVYEAAKVLTGWTIDWDTIYEVGEVKPYFEADNHDTDSKQFSSFFGDSVIEGKSGEDGGSEVQELIDMIFDNDETAKYLCRRIYNFFVYHEIDATIESSIIEPLAQILREHHYDVAPVMKTLLTSEHFYSEVNIGAYVKNPLEHLLGIFRTMGVASPDDHEEGYKFFDNMYWLIANLGLEVGDPPNVSGWQAYYQLPGYDKLWIDSNTVTKRAQYQDYLIYQLLDIPNFISRLHNPSDPNDLIQELNLLFQGIPVDDEVVYSLKLNLLAGEQTDDYWSNAWALYVSNPEDESYRVSVENRLKALFQQLFQLGEFQLM